MVCSTVAEFLLMGLAFGYNYLFIWIKRLITAVNDWYKTTWKDTLIPKFYVSVVPEGKEHMQQENWEDICHGSQASIKLDNDYESITIDILHKAVGMGSFSHDRESNQHPTEVVPSHTHLLCASHQNMSFGNLNVIGMAEGDRHIMRFACELFYSSANEVF